MTAKPVGRKRRKRRADGAVPLYLQFSLHHDAGEAAPGDLIVGGHLRGSRTELLDTLTRLMRAIVINTEPDTPPES